MSQEVTGDISAALSFLAWVRPEGPWVLTGVAPDRKKIETATFTDLKTLSIWLTPRVGVLNLYWMVNSPRGSLVSKASKEDVQSMDFLHVDCDPAKGLTGKAFAAERAAILERLKSFKPPPSAIVDSGGGYQAFWRLKEPVIVAGSVSRAEEVEAYNLQLEMLLKGDHCHNVDRIMRLPGTVNLPDEKKKAAGREAAPAVAVSTSELEYDLDHFTPAPRVQTKDIRDPGAAISVKVAGNLPPVLVDDLPETVPPRIKMLIVQGSDPDEPTKYGSRSEVVWAVLCSLVRAGCDDNTIASVLLDPDYAVSAHVLAQKRSVQYVERQIQRAREEVVEPWLRKLNELHCVISDIGGKCRIVSEVMDETVDPPRPRLSKQTFEDFRNRYMHVKVQVGKNDKGEPIYKPAGKWWLEHPLRRQYETLVFAPNRVVENAYNMWAGFSCEAIPGNGHQIFLDHILQNICSGNKEWYEYIIKWMARGVQEPGSQGEVAIVLRGGRGTGKGTLATYYGSLWGRHFLHLSSAKHLVGQFNAHLRDCVIIYADEAFFAGDRQHEGVLKTLITERTLVVEPKGVDAEVTNNYTHLIMASNSDWVIPAGGDERRFMVLDVSEDRKQDTAFFGQLRDAMDNGGRESLLHYLMTLDLTGFDVRAVPQTGALQAQKVFSLSLEESWWLERLTDGRSTAGSEVWDITLPKQQLFADYIRYAEQQRINRRLSPVALGMFLNKVLPAQFPKSVQRVREVEKISSDTGLVETVRERVYFYDLPNLDDARARWEKNYGEFNWPSEEQGVNDSGYEAMEPY